MARSDMLTMCDRLGIVPGPSYREWATSFGQFWLAFGPIVYWNERAKEYW